MKKLSKKTFLIIISVSLTVLLIIGICGMYALLRRPRPWVAPEPYVIPTEFSTSYTVEEHKEKIYQRAMEIAESIDYDGRILYDIVYDLQDQPRYFIVEFDEVVCFYVGKDKRSQSKNPSDQYIYTRTVCGAIINDEYYISSYGLGSELELYEPATWNTWSAKVDIESTPPSIYTLLDVWDCKKYYYNLYEKNGVKYYGKYELAWEELLGADREDVYYAKKYKSTEKEWNGKYDWYIPYYNRLKMNPFTNYDYATSLDQAYIFKVYEKTA